MEQDYKSYTIAELEDVCEHIDKHKHPERYKNASAALGYKKSLKPAQPEEKDSDFASFWFPKRSTKMKIFTSGILLLGLAACIYYGAIPWKGREELITPDKDPILFWFIIVFLTFLAIMQLFTIESKDEKSET